MFIGIGDAEWEIIKTALPWKEKRTRGMPHAEYRFVLNIAKRKETQERILES